MFRLTVATFLAIHSTHYLSIGTNLSRPVRLAKSSMTLTAPRSTNGVRPDDGGAFLGLAGKGPFRLEVSPANPLRGADTDFNCATP